MEELQVLIRGYMIIKMNGVFLFRFPSKGD